MNELALFAGAGGGLLASRLLGWTTIGAVEIEPYCRRILMQRQDDGHLDPFPIWDDVRTFDARPWRGLVDVVSGGFPCQDISAAGKGEGLTGARSSLWFEFERIVGECRPRFVFAENSPLLRTRGLGRVIQGLTGLGYDVRWCVLGARHVGGRCQRDRMWILACPEVRGVEEPVRSAAPDLTDRPRDNDGDGGGTDVRRESVPPVPPGHTEVPKAGTPDAVRSAGWWAHEPEVARVAYGMADWVGQQRAIGNGQVPLVAATAWKILSGLTA